MFENLRDVITSDKVKGTVAVIAAVVMYFTPDYIDRIIESLLGVYGITALTLGKKGEDIHDQGQN
jgi:hypothetical protein